MAKGYKKKKRASKYEEKVAINASFEDAIKIMLGMEPITFPINKTFTIPRDSRFEPDYLREHYSIKIPSTAIGNLRIVLKLITDSVFPAVSVIAEHQIFDNNGSVVYESISKTHPFKLNPNEFSPVKEAEINFLPNDSNFLAETISISMAPLNKDVTLEVVIQAR